MDIMGAQDPYVKLEILYTNDKSINKRENAYLWKQTKLNNLSTITQTGVIEGGGTDPNWEEGNINNILYLPFKGYQDIITTNKSNKINIDENDTNWVSILDPSSGKYYYYHLLKEIWQWNKPKGYEGLIISHKFHVSFLTYIYSNTQNSRLI